MEGSSSKKDKDKGKSPKDGKKKKGCKECFRHRAGMCRCWYCCLCSLPLFWIWGCTLLALSLYCAITFLRGGKNIGIWQLHVVFWPTLVIAVLFLVVVQMAYFLVMFESIRKLGVIILVVLVILTFLICLVVLYFATYCPRYCSESKGGEGESKNLTGKDAIISRNVEICRFGAAITFILLIFTLHIYCFHLQRFKEEQEGIEIDCCDEEDQEGESADPNKPNKSENPDAKESGLNNNNNGKKTDEDKTKGETGQTATQSTQTLAQQNPVEYQYEPDMPKNVKLFYFKL